MQNIDPLYFIEPIVIIAFSFGLVFYWSKKRSFSKLVVIYSLAAYAGAIVIKEIVQIPTYSALESASGNNPFVLGLYFGIQTALFEVGGAFLVANFAVSRGQFRAKDAEAFGIGLALWENGVLIAIPALLNYVIYYAILGAPNSSIAQTLYSDLTTSATSLFYGPSGALPLIGYSILERISSLLVHFSWGYLAVLSAVYRKRIYLVLALPMGFIDFFVPFASKLGTGRFELLIFVISVIAMSSSLYVVRNERRKLNVEKQNLRIQTDVPTQALAAEEPMNTASAEDVDSEQENLITLGALSSVNFRRSVTYGRIYLVLGLGALLLITLSTSVLPTTPTTTQYIQSQGQALGIHSAAALVIVSIFPLLSPIFAVIGSLGSLMIFASDKAKGVYEYLISYGVDTSRIFWSIIISAIGLVTIVLVISISLVTVVLSMLNNALPFQYVELIIIYTIPLSYASSIFMTMIGMIWSSLTTRRAGVNSPVGLAPIFGIIPVLVVLVVSEKIAPGYLAILAGGFSLALILLVALLVAISNGKMVRERFISTG